MFTIMMMTQCNCNMRYAKQVDITLIKIQQQLTIRDFNKILICKLNLSQPDNTLCEHVIVVGDLQFISDLVRENVNRRLHFQVSNFLQTQSKTVVTRDIDALRSATNFADETEVRCKFHTRLL